MFSIDHFEKSMGTETRYHYMAAEHFLEQEDLKPEEAVGLASAAFHIKDIDEDLYSESRNAINKYMDQKTCSYAVKHDQISFSNLRRRMKDQRELWNDVLNWNESKQDEDMLNWLSAARESIVFQGEKPMSEEY